MSELAIIMAAGMGTRMRPLTETIPKPLIKVYGEPLIETVIEGLERRGVEKIIVVVGYLGEQFSYLEQKYSNLKIIENSDYQTVNNISSIFYVADEVINTENDVFICEADLYIGDDKLFDTTLDHSCYFGKMVHGYSDDWVFDIDNKGRITRVGKGGENCFNMVGIAWFNNNDARLLGDMIKEAYGKPGYEALFWDDIVNQNIDILDLTVHEVKKDQIIEIDTVEELIRIDNTYAL